MPQDLFKWEDQGGLKHHCPICQTPLSHEKCRTVCLGNHVEWCHRYHCLFRKNWSSRCSACKTTDEQHEKRHREIAEILAKIKKFKAEEEAAAMELLGSLATPKTPRTPLTAKALNSVTAASDTLSIEIPKTTKKERKAAKKAAKAMDRDKVVTSADIKLVAEILHPNGEKAEELEGAEMADLEEDLDIKANLKFNNSTCNSKSVRHDYIAKDREQKEVEKAEVERVLLSLDVNPKAIGKEGELVAELSQAIKNDLVHHHDELKIVARNKAGFWKWANKRNYRDLVENGKDWDAKHDREPGQSQPQAPEAEDRRESDVTDATDATVDTADTEADDEALASRSDSVVDSLTESAGTALTIPSKKSSSRKASLVGGSASTPPTTPSTKNSSAKKARTLTLEIGPPKKRDAGQDDDGWTTVGKKVLKPPVGTLTFSANGGLHHLEQKPKSNFWALSKLE